jgi:ribokinase
MFDIITIGSATQDVFLKSNSFLHVKDPDHLKKMGFPKGEAECFAVGAKIELDDFQVSFGGGGSNSAVGFAKQGFKTVIITKVGDDVVGERVIKNLKDNEVETIVSKDKIQKTSYSSILLMPNGERTILMYRGVTGKITKKDVPFRQLKAKWGYISTSDISFSVIANSVDTLKRNNAKVAMNPSKTYIKMGINKLKPLLKKVDVLLLNREEASLLTGVDYEDGKKIFRKIDKLIENGIVVMTEGSKGSLVSDGRYLYRAGVYEGKETIDKTGAGDAFGVGFIAGIIRKNDINYALKLGSANALAVIESIGAQTGLLNKNGFRKNRFEYLDLDIEPLI